MPLFDYHCGACGAAFELLVRGGTVPACKQCGSTAVERQVSLTSPQGTAQATIAAGRRLAAREGHFSHYSKADRARIK
jgi:putative FmdB family regulatory protein